MSSSEAIRSVEVTKPSEKDESQSGLCSYTSPTKTRISVRELTNGGDAGMGEVGNESAFRS